MYCVSASHHPAAGVCLPGLFIEQLAGHAEVCALVNQSIKLLASREHAVNCLMQDDLSLIKVSLYLGKLVSGSRVLQHGKNSMTIMACLC